MLEHYTVAGLVGGLAPWTMSFHELFFQLTLLQGKQSRIILPACHLYRTGSHSWEEQCWLLLKPEPPLPRAYPDQWCRETEQSPGADGRHGLVVQDLGGERIETVFLLCSQDDTLVSNTGFYTIPGWSFMPKAHCTQYSHPSTQQAQLLSFQDHMRTGHVQGGVAIEYSFS